MQVEWLYSGDPWANAYVVGNILVDAGVMPMAVAPYKERVETIVLTHCHFDHIARVKEIAHMCRAKVPSTGPMPGGLSMRSTASR